jgi:LCP family protein required for cell wall assembly
MTKAKRKRRNVWRKILVVEIIILIIAGLVAFYVLVLSKSPALRFIGRMLSPVEGGKNIAARREETKKPFDLTAGERYYKRLVRKDSINVLVIGCDAEGANYDTLLIVSIDEENNLVRLINIPRDIYIDYSEEVLAKLQKSFPKYKSSKGIFKINAAHSVGRFIGYKKDSGRFSNPEYEFTADLIEEIFGIYIDDYIFLKPSTFRRVVDYFGGVDINVPYHMQYSDPVQNFSVHLEKGMQHLDGAQAEGFVRYRQGYDENGKFKGLGDIERKKNQDAFVKAFMEQHMNLRNIGKIITIFGELDEYLVSSIDSAEETGDYGKVAEKLYKNKFTTESTEIECTDVKIGGVYYLKMKTSEK